MRLFKSYSKTLVRPVRPVRLTSAVDVPRFSGRKSQRPTFLGTMASTLSESVGIGDGTGNENGKKKKK